MNPESNFNSEEEVTDVEKSRIKRQAITAFHEGNLRNPYPQNKPERRRLWNIYFQEAKNSSR